MSNEGSTGVSPQKAGLTLSLRTSRNWSQVSSRTRPQVSGMRVEISGRVSGPVPVSLPTRVVLVGAVPLLVVVVDPLLLADIHTASAQLGPHK